MIFDMNNKEIINTKKNKLSKQILGQFYTTNQEYILQGMQIPKNIENSDSIPKILLIKCKVKIRENIIMC